jgi:hypothetical protein
MSVSKKSGKILSDVLPASKMEQAIKIQRENKGIVLLFL